VAPGTATPPDKSRGRVPTDEEQRRPAGVVWYVAVIEPG
jgi:hypothetical protein